MKEQRIKWFRRDSLHNCMFHLLISFFLPLASQFLHLYAIVFAPFTSPRALDFSPLFLSHLLHHAAVSSLSKEIFYAHSTSSLHDHRYNHLAAFLIAQLALNLVVEKSSRCKHLRFNFFWICCSVFNLVVKLLLRFINWAIILWN